MKITKLYCDYMVNPLGYDLEKPTLNWVIESAGKRQTAYQLQISKCPCFNETVLDTGRVESGESVGYRYDGTLEKCTRYYWRVNAWDDLGNESGFSDVNWFETARYDTPWTAQWIGSDGVSPQLRKHVRIEKEIKSARAYACGMGIYNFFINGQRASDELLTPGFHAYNLWMGYQTYDVTDKLHAGDNVLGAWLGRGYYCGRVNWPGIDRRENIYGDRMGFIMELVLNYADGTSETIVTDPTWEGGSSPYMRTEIYDGEIFDANLYDEKWCESWDDAAPRAIPVDIDRKLLTARKNIPVRVKKEFPVSRKIITPAGEQVFDFSQNIAGLLRFKVNAPKGTEILFQFGERLDKDGNFYRDNMRTALAEIRYISDGKERTYAPNFTFFGFQYVRITGWEFAPEDLTAQAIYSDMVTIGHFECSDPRVNQLFSNALWSQRDNFVDTPTDCPQRDERMGWTGDAQVFAPTACMNMASDAFYKKYLYDLKQEQNRHGYVPVVVPFIINGSGIWEFPTTGWGDAAVLIPWDLYMYYGDKAALENQYESMKAWVDFMRAQDTAGNNLYEGFHLGDWLAQDTKDPDNLFGLTPTTLAATAYYAWSADYVAKTAKILGREDDEKTYAALAEDVRRAFRAEFVSDTGRVSSETQTAYLLALNMNMLREDQIPKAVSCLAERIEIDRVHLTTGFLGTPYLCPVLSEYGLNEYAYSLLMQTDCPSWLYPVSMGATTVWERWNSVRPDGSFGPVSMNSLNHYAFGAIVEWLYRYVAGINACADAPGYKHSLIRPMVNDMLQSASASIETPYGKIGSSWALDEDSIRIDAVVPFNTTASVMLPDSEGTVIRVNGTELEPAYIKDGCAVYECACGSYTFEYTPNGKTIRKRIPQKVLPRF